ncbi:acetyltransferase [Metasolibacillus fluoroglycofenilyticus]|uniref:acetyltransferase n=1 Tax=Metasolibacillus fluoroglycofenilyticus TaxID=1239396 RepID=UPI000D38AE3A|nr:acetyltransferase [Metasolibacillus fluoroglycofenilyticus]
MKKIVIYGSGGFAREVVHLIEDINRNSGEWEIIGFLDDNMDNHGLKVNELPVLGGAEWLEGKNNIHVVLGIGSPKAKKAIVTKLSKYEHVIYPNLIHPAVTFSRFNTIGQGNIICEGNVLTVNIDIENFTIINLNCTIGHDVTVKNYTTILPNSSVSGDVVFEEGVDFGTNATIIQGITIGDWTIVGAGAVVVKDLPAKCTAVGAPAKPIKFHE